MHKTIVINGALAFDFIFTLDNYFSNYILPEKIHQINISLATESHQRTFGGPGGNQAFYLGRLDMAPYILMTAGNDFHDYGNFLSKNGVKTDFIKIIKTKPTAMGSVLTDKSNNQIWVFSQGAVKNSQKLTLNNVIRKLNKFFLMITPNYPQTMINFINEAVEKNIEFAFDPAFYIPVLPKEALVKGIRKARIIFGNDYEISFLEKNSGLKLKNSLKPEQILVKTLGEFGSEIYQDKKKIKIGIHRVKTIDPTGAGDAYRSGFLYGYLNNYSLKDCGRIGAVTSSFAVEIKGTINKKFTKKLLFERLRSASC